MIRLEWFGFIRRAVWKNTGFADLRTIREHIEIYEPRYEPTVIPISDPSSTVVEQTPPPDLATKSDGQPLKYYSVAAYHQLYMSGELTPLAVVKAILPLIRRDISPPGIHSTAWFDSKIDIIFAAAKESTLRYKEKRPLGLLDGVPTAVKDEYDVDGYRTTLGSVNDYTNKTLAADESITSWPVRKLEEAGAINLGKLSMHEFGLGWSPLAPLCLPQSCYRQKLMAKTHPAATTITELPPTPTIRTTTLVAPPAAAHMQFP